MEMETPDLYLFVFFGIKERPAEAPFMTLKNNKDKEELQCTAGLASYFNYLAILFRIDNNILHYQNGLETDIFCMFFYYLQHCFLDCFLQIRL